jgi:cysteine desulfuration protein SufE
VNLAAHQSQLLAELAAHRDPQERLAWLVARSEAAPRLSAAEKNDTTRVPGCLSQLWLVGHLREGRCEFRSDSDSRIVRAVAGLLCAFFSGLEPTTVLASEAAPLKHAGLDRLLAANRRNAVSRVQERIRELAREFADQPTAT